MRVHIAQRLAVAAEEILAERYLESQLPEWAKEIYVPVDLADTRTVRLRTAEQKSIGALR